MYSFGLVFQNPDKTIKFFALNKNWVALRIKVKGYLQRIKFKVFTIRNDRKTEISLANIFAIEFLGRIPCSLLILEQYRPKAVKFTIGINALDDTLLDVSMLSKEVSDLLIANPVRQTIDFNSHPVHFTDWSNK